MNTLGSELSLKLVGETTALDWKLERERKRLLVRWVAMATAEPTRCSLTIYDIRLDCLHPHQYGRKNGKEGGRNSGNSSLFQNVSFLLIKKTKEVKRSKI
jgi:hypothetical protein